MKVAPLGAKFLCIGDWDLDTIKVQQEGALLHPDNLLIEHWVALQAFIEAKNMTLVSLSDMLNVDELIRIHGTMSTPGQPQRFFSRIPRGLQTEWCGPSDLD
jgi:hypothetical protein